MVNRDPGTILITGPTGGLGRETTLAMARRPASQRPDLILLGRAGQRLTQVADEARTAGATVHEIGCDLANLADVRAAATATKNLRASGAVRPLHGLVANAGVTVRDTRGATADGYEQTFAINYLAHAQLIAELLTSFAAPARIVLLGSNTYYANVVRKLLGVAAADWRDPIELAQPAPARARTSMKTSGTAYSNSKLALLYYAHELQRRAPAGVNVVVFEPGFMPGTGLGREYGAAAQRVSRAIGHLPGVSKPSTSGPALASVVLDERWAHLRDGAFVLINKERPVQPFADDRDREGRLWDATTALLQQERQASEQ
jgi:NAD(P)-dependent dehydrogenase (short-subunit alcohol dehydrogenase family)